MHEGVQTAVLILPLALVSFYFILSAQKSAEYWRRESRRWEYEYKLLLQERYNCCVRQQD